MDGKQQNAGSMVCMSVTCMDNKWHGMSRVDTASNVESDEATEERLRR